MHQDDYIDYPCSPTFVSGLAEMGLAQDYPDKFYSRKRETECPSEEIEALRRQVEQLQGRLTYMEHTRQKKRDII